MSVDILQEKIRKTRNPSVPVLEAFAHLVPPAYTEAASLPEALKLYYSALLERLKGTVPGVRFGFGSFALLGGPGLEALSTLTARAGELGFYVLLDAPETLSPQAAASAAAALAGEGWSWDGLVISGWLGSDILKAYLPLCKKGKSLFCLVRSGNKSAPELQDLLSGSRLVHTALADILCRHGEPMVGKFGYSQLGAIAPATSADSLRALRAKYPRLFLLLDGYDYSFGNAKNCSHAFDRLGHGAAVCALESLAGAWREADSGDPLDAALEAANRMKKNLSRYITVL